MAYCIIHIAEDGERFCETVGNVCYEAYRTMREAWKREHHLNRLARAQGWGSRYAAAPLPAGLVPHFEEGASL